MFTGCQWCNGDLAIHSEPVVSSSVCVIWAWRAGDVAITQPRFHVSSAHVLTESVMRQRCRYPAQLARVFSTCFKDWASQWCERDVASDIKVHVSSVHVLTSSLMWQGCPYDSTSLCVFSTCDDWVSDEIRICRYPTQIPCGFSTCVDWVSGVTWTSLWLNWESPLCLQYLYWLSQWLDSDVPMTHPESMWLQYMCWFSQLSDRDVAVQQESMFLKYMCRFTKWCNRKVAT